MALAAVDGMENALRLEEQRSASLLGALRAGQGLALHEGSYRVPQSTLVRDALTAVYFYRAENRVEGTQERASKLIETIRQIVDDSAAIASPVELEAMEAALHRAEMLNAAAPAMKIEAASLSKSPHPAKEIAYAKNVTVLAFYAPWSPQRKQMFELLASMGRDYKTFPVQIFAVCTAGIATGDATAKPAEVLANLLEEFGKAGAPATVVVAPEASTKDFAVNDWPMFAVVDPAGTVRFLDTLSSPEYKDGGRMHRLVAALASQAGPLPQPPAAKKSRRVFVPQEKLERRPK